MNRQVNLLLLVYLMLIGAALPSHATTTCAYNFHSGSNSTYLSYCVTANGNILGIQTPFGQNMLGTNGEGYGICNQSSAVNYTDYAVSDTGNWQGPVVLSHSSTSVKIARTTADGNWTLTQTITMVPKTYSITVVMVLKNNLSVDNAAYLLRFADAETAIASQKYAGLYWGGALYSAFLRTSQPDPNYGFVLENVGIPSFSFWQGYAQWVNTGPNACLPTGNELDNYMEYVPGQSGAPGSIEMVYSGNVPAGQTKTVTLSYHAM